MWDLCSHQPWSKVLYPGKCFWKKEHSSPPVLPKTWFYLSQAAEVVGTQSPKPSGRNRQGTGLTRCHRTWPTTTANVHGPFSLSQSKLNYKLQKSCGAECLSPLQEHTARIPSCWLAASPVTSGTTEISSTSVGGQENGWPSIPSTKFTPRLLTAQAVLALNTGVTSTRAFWNINCLCSLKATLLCPGNTVPIDRVFLWIFLPQQECKSCALLPYFSYPVHKRTAVRLIWLEFTVQCVCTTALSSAHFPLPIFFVIQNHLCYYRENWYLLLQHHHLQ